MNEAERLAEDEAQVMADHYLKNHGSELFFEFRKDGWPLCPQCREDELWSEVAISASRAVALEECWDGDFTCYFCNWKSNGKRHRKSTPEERILEFCYGEEAIAEMTPAEVDEELRREGLDPNVLTEKFRNRIGHLRFIGGEILCFAAHKRVQLGDDHKYADGFTCPACGAVVPSLAERDAALRS